ncbi:hypothetical protein DPMN_011681 [Dreissena polymorpha]|uniref:MAM domain-containing protein n=1 Tax=Dreissena polymorpha TaxID=45954 RepID=A0A9D4N4G1_DREPO|nr:hypothetical protein DPMN_011681 [Dreissena polymorpha]
MKPCSDIFQATQPNGATDSSALACNFEAQDLCGYVNMQGSDDFDWIRNHGQTTSVGTGPFADHTLGTVTGRGMK